MDRIAVEPGYESLAAVLDEALIQAQAGKGKERHANDEPFDEQLICQLCRQDGIGFATGQAKKKTTESHRLEGEFGIKELLGAINYLAAAVIVRREKAGQGAKPAASTEMRRVEGFEFTCADCREAYLPSNWDSASLRASKLAGPPCSGCSQARPSISEDEFFGHPGLPASLKSA